MVIIVYFKAPDLQAKADNKRVGRHEQGVQSPGYHLRGDDTNPGVRVHAHQLDQLHHERDRGAQVGESPSPQKRR